MNLKPWMFGAVMVALLAAAQIATEWVFIQSEKLSASVNDLGRQRIIAQDLVRLSQTFRSEPDQRKQLEATAIRLTASRDRLAASGIREELGHTYELQLKRSIALQKLDLLLRDFAAVRRDGYSRPLSNLIAEDVLAAQDGLLVAATDVLNQSKPRLVFWRRAIEIGNVLLLAVIVILGIGQALRTRRHEQEKEALKNEGLARESRLFKDLYHTSPIMLYSVDAKGRITRVNDAWLDKMGFKLQDVLGKATRDFMSAASRAELDKASGGAALVTDLIEQGQVNGLPVTFITHEGMEVHASVSAKLLVDSAGEPIGANCIVVDQTDRIQANQKLEQTRARLFKAFSSMPVPMFHTDLDGRFLRANEAALAAFGVTTVEEINELDFESVFSVAAMRLTRKKAATINNEPLSLINGRGRPLEGRLSLRAVAEYESTFIEGVFVDVTELEETRRVVSRSRKMYRELYDTTPIMMYSINKKGEITNANHFWLERLGYARDEVLGELSLKFIQYGDTPEVLQQVRTLFEQKAAFVWDLNLVTKSGEVLEGQVHGAPVRNARGEIEGAMLSFVDKTGERAAEKERDRIAEELHTAQKLEAIGQLAAGIAHEINTPSQYVSDNLTFLADSFKDLRPVLTRIQETTNGGTALAADEQAELTKQADLDFLMEELPVALDQCQDGISQIKKIVLAMKEFSHPGHQDMSPTNLNKLIESVTTVARNEWKYVAELELCLDPDLPFVPCVPSAINQVMLNMIVNAGHAIADATEESGSLGRIRIETGVVDTVARVSISDSGTGMDEETKRKIFDPFFTTKEVGKGTGQGLAIAYRIVNEVHGGSISVESELGKGTTFHVQLPLDQAPPQESAA